MIFKSDNPPDYDELFGIESRPKRVARKRISHHFVKVFNFLMECSRCSCKRNDNDNDNDNCMCFLLNAPEFPFFPEKKPIDDGDIGKVQDPFYRETQPAEYRFYRCAVTIYKKTEYAYILRFDHDFEGPRSGSLMGSYRKVSDLDFIKVCIYDFDTTRNSVTMTLPENPHHEDIILVINSLGTFGTNNGIIKAAREDTINGTKSDYIMNIPFAMYNIYYSKPGKNWTVFSCFNL